MQTPFNKGDWFARRLALDGLSEQELLQVLEGPSEGADRPEPPPPAWVVDLREVLRREEAQPRKLLPEVAALTKPSDGFLYLIEPLLAWARQEAAAGIRQLVNHFPGGPLEPATALQALYASLPQRLFSMIHRTLLLELQVAQLQGTLEGATPEVRFIHFVLRLRQPGTRLGLWREYPVLTRQLMVTARQWLETGLEFLTRLCEDWEVLRGALGVSGCLAAVREGGDRHDNGRAVRIAEFGPGQRIVYKPRSMACDAHFQELLGWLNDRGGCLPMRLLKVLDRGAYGWCEFVESQPCSSPEELERFYERQGSNLALHYVLHSTDVHFENLIAVGEHPLLVDLETLFQGRFAGEESEGSQKMAARTVGSSVLRVSLLPQRQWADGEGGYRGIDVSGMEAKAGQLSAERVMHWEGEGTDTMRVARRRVAIEGAKNRPTLQGTEVSALEHADTVVRGFTRMYRMLQECREALLAEGGPLARFAGDRIRVILRHTLLYSKLQEESFHPDMLRDALERDRLFDRLWFGVDQEPYLTRAIDTEHAELWRGDVPVFTTRPDSRDVWDGMGKRIPNLLAQPGLELVGRRLRELDEEDLRRQVWFIRASITTLASTLDKAAARGHRLPAAEPATAEQLFLAAEAVAERLESLALRGADDATWIGLTPATTLEPVWVDLYDGGPGITLFCAYLGKLTGKARYTELARAAWTNVRRQLATNDPKLTSVGFFSGWGGLLYVLAHLDALWGGQEARQELEAMLELLPALIERDEELDMLAGSAGCILALGVVRQQLPALAKRVRELQLLCGERLLKRAQQLPVGLGWTNPTSALQPLSGFSHGGAGYALALLELAESSGEARFRQAAQAALDYERSTYSPQERNWRDMRAPSLLGRPAGESFFSLAWCHGAPGIGMARLRMLDYVDDAQVRGEIDAALATTNARGFGMSHSLCHGDLGNVELMLVAASKLGEAGGHWDQRVRALSGSILQSIREQGWKCGNPSQVEMPGLMTGLAGIGYGLLRLAAPDRIPSILALEPPRASKGEGV